MHRFQKGIRFLIFILFLGLLFFVLTLIRTAYTSHMSDGYKLLFTEIEFYIVFGIVSIVAICLGLILPSQFRSWTHETFVERQSNIITINKLIISLHQRKAELLIKTPVLKEIPDPVQVFISSKKLDFNDVLNPELTRKKK